MTEYVSDPAALIFFLSLLIKGLGLQCSVCIRLKNRGLEITHAHQMDPVFILNQD